MASILTKLNQSNGIETLNDIVSLRYNNDINTFNCDNNEIYTLYVTKCNEDINGFYFFSGNRNKFPHFVHWNKITNKNNTNCDPHIWINPHRGWNISNEIHDDVNLLYYAYPVSPKPPIDASNWRTQSLLYTYTNDANNQISLPNIKILPLGKSKIIDLVIVGYVRNEKLIHHKISMDIINIISLYIFHKITDKCSNIICNEASISSTLFGSDWYCDNCVPTTKIGYSTTE
mmetsp:Transcript_8985/g.11213  ORF Transcript_8985/g.11213 Transcript_8985/m.11213 type:complete len:231 (+) Transcript_8985:44-736(+)